MCFTGRQGCVFFLFVERMTMQLGGWHSSLLMNGTRVFKV